MSNRATPTRRDRIILATAAPLGALLLLLTWFGNAVGIPILPLDQHHILGQVAGFGLLFWGLIHWK
jgi:hypothetical protein